ncbi:MAG: Eco57I restriction-modification methylase domain-containing protein [Anaerococcus obesiensis]
MESNQKLRTDILLERIINGFNPRSAKNEDDIKIRTYSDIIKPIIQEVNPDAINNYYSEPNLNTSCYKGGRADASFENLVFEFKKYEVFDKQSGVDEALYGRPGKEDHGLEHYIKSISGWKESDARVIQDKKLSSVYGIGFDGKTFLFARYAFDYTSNKLSFKYDRMNFKDGLYYLILLFKQDQKIALTKNNLLDKINPNKKFVQRSIKYLYSDLEEYVFSNDTFKLSPRSRTLYEEWNHVFGKIYGEESEETEFTEVIPSIKKLYNIDSEKDINSKWFLFSLQTFMNIFLKLLINRFLSDLINPSFNSFKTMTKPEIMGLFMGEDKEQNRLVRNFFETHYLEWFVVSKGNNDVKVVNDTLKVIEKFDLTSFVLKPENLQDIFEELYMGLIPDEMRHIMGEYFSPDWIVEHTLNEVGYTGMDISKKIVDPTCGSGNFIIQALKRAINHKNGYFTKSQINTICENIVGFDINPISVVAARANYIIAIFSAYFSTGYNYNPDDWIGEEIDIPIYIADSVLAPIVYSEDNGEALLTKTTVGDFKIPKFKSINKANQFLGYLSECIHEKSHGKFEVFWGLIIGNDILEERYKDMVYILYEQLYMLHMQGHDSFWPIILKNSFAPLIINDKFDYVVGNPPWIAWKSMSNAYRKGTLDVWLSYGIFEKNAYDKKTTHDDFGMAVVYVAIDQYLKDSGKLAFLLPASFLKSAKGGQGFRKFEITRNNQNIPFSVEIVNDFSDVHLFTIPTILSVFKKGTEMTYPFKNYKRWIQINGKKRLDSHSTWSMVKSKFFSSKQIAQPIDLSDKTSAWLTVEKDFYSIANTITNSNIVSPYRGRKGVEPAGAKGVYVLKDVVKQDNEKIIVSGDFSRQRRKDIKDIGERRAKVEQEFIYPMLGGRNIEKWRVKSFEFMLIPHDLENLYGIQEEDLARRSPKTLRYLKVYEKPLFASRLQNGKFFNPDIQPFYRLDNIGSYTFARYKVLWKEQTKNFAAVAVDTFNNTLPSVTNLYFDYDRPFVVDSKVLMLECNSMEEAYYVSGILNSPVISRIIDAYAIATNRGIDVLQNIKVPRFDSNNLVHAQISNISRELHLDRQNQISKYNIIESLEKKLDLLVLQLYSIEV